MMVIANFAFWTDGIEAGLENECLLLPCNDPPADNQRLKTGQSIL